MKERPDINKRILLTLEEAALYSGIGINKLREISNSEDCTFVLFNGSRRMIKRERLEQYLLQAYSIWYLWAIRRARL